MRWIVRGAVGLLALVSALALGLWLFPLKRYVPEIERAASEGLGVPVRIADLRLALLPAPHVTASEITLDAPGHLARVDALRLYPALGSLASPVKVLRRVELDGVEASSALLAALAGQKRTASPPAFRVEQIVLRSVRLTAPGAVLPVLDGELWLDAKSRPTRAQLRTDDGAARLDAEQQGERLVLRLSAAKWSAPVGAGLRIEALDALGTMAGQRLDLSVVEATLLDGSIAGKAALDWSRGWQVAGDLRTQGVQVEPLLRMLGQKPQLAGRLDAQARFSARAKEPPQLADALRADGSFALRQGVLRNVDLARAASFAGGAQGSGGETRFDEFGGRFQVSGKAYRISGLSARSGLLSAGGEVSVSPAKQLAGSVKVEIKSGVSLVEVPLKVSGTVQEPRLYPTGAAVAGAAVGTAVMGPGAGTGLGVRAAEAIGRLFGGGK